jgi:hypothetical protein
MTGVPAIAEVRLKGGPGSGQGFSLADWQTQILAALRMGRRIPAGPGWALGYPEFVKVVEASGSYAAVC